VDFLYRFVPKLRNFSKSLTEEFEVFFVKEVASKGYIFQK